MKIHSTVPRPCLAVESSMRKIPFLFLLLLICAKPYQLARGADTLAHQYQDTRTSMDVSIGPWRAIIDLFRMMHGGLMSRGSREDSGPVRRRARACPTHQL